MKISILTPTYNRRELLGKLYASLTEQSDTDFIWIVVDDGSTDGTEEQVAAWKNAGTPFELCYLKKENGGKSKALNYAFRQNPDVFFFAVIDSDDYALPDAVKTIRACVERYAEREDVGGIWFRYNNPDGTTLALKGGNSHKEEVVMTRYEHDAVYSKDDGCIGYFGRAVAEYLYPEYPNEKYVGPIVVQMEMADKYKIAFTVETIGVAEYQPGGLSKSGRKLRIRNPLGMIHYCGLLQSRKNPVFKSRMKYTVCAQAYRVLSSYKKKDLLSYGIQKQWLKRWAFLPGCCLAVYWRKK